MGKVISYCNINCTSGEVVELFRSLEMDYPKFFKMDSLSRLGVVAAEMVLRDAGYVPEEPKEDMSAVIVNSVSCMDNDVAFQKGLAPDNYYPSPSLFVYTLSNIVCGEIAIRNKVLGETSFFVTERFDAEYLAEKVAWTFQDKEIKRVLCGWLDSFDGKVCAHMYLVEEGVSAEELKLKTK